MFRMSRWIGLALLAGLLVFSACSSSDDSSSPPAGPTYNDFSDDFASGELASRYAAQELARYLLDDGTGNHVLSLGVGSDGGDARQTAIEVLQPNVTSIVADVTVTSEEQPSGEPDALSAQIKLGGYNAGGSTGSGDRTGDVIGIVKLSGTVARLVIIQCTNADCTTWDDVDSIELNASLTINTTYTASISYDGNVSFAGFINGTGTQLSGPAKAGAVVGNYPRLAAFAGSGKAGRLYATFDNVLVGTGGSTAFSYDDFEGTGGNINQTKWVEQEAQREVVNDALKLRLDNVGTTTNQGEVLTLATDPNPTLHSQKIAGTLTVTEAFLAPGNLPRVRYVLELRYIPSGDPGDLTDALFVRGGMQATNAAGLTPLAQAFLCNDATCSSPNGATGTMSGTAQTLAVNTPVDVSVVVNGTSATVTVGTESGAFDLSEVGFTGADPYEARARIDTRTDTTAAAYAAGTVVVDDLVVGTP